jgi:hypothetical protein
LSIRLLAPAWRLRLDHAASNAAASGPDGRNVSLASRTPAGLDDTRNYQPRQLLSGSAPGVEHHSTCLRFFG